MQIKDLYRSVTDAIVAELEAGAVPWVRPWKGTDLMPTNALTKKRYNGINIPIFWYTASKRGYEHHLWCTYRQALEIGAQVRKGEQAAHIVYTSTYTKIVEDEAATARFLKSYFHNRTHEQRFGIPSFRVLMVTTTPARVDNMIAAYQRLIRPEPVSAPTGLFLFTDRATLAAHDGDLLAVPWQNGAGKPVFLSP